MGAVLPRLIEACYYTIHWMHIAGLRHDHTHPEYPEINNPTNGYFVNLIVWNSYIGLLGINAIYIIIDFCLVKNGSEWCCPNKCCKYADCIGKYVVYLF